MKDLRPLRIQDLPFVYRMVGQGASFDTQLRLTVGDDALHQALLTGRGRIQPYILRLQGGESGLGVLHLPGRDAGGHHARLAYMAPSLGNGASEDLWLQMLDGLVSIAGKQGFVNLIAEVDVGEPALEILRQANFATYARQEIWMRPAAPLAEGESRHAIRPALAVDEPAIMGVYSSLVPALLKHVEPPPTTADEIFVMDGDDGLRGVLTLYKGVHASLIEMHLLPQAHDRARAALGTALNIVHADSYPVFCRVRASAAPVEKALDDLGFDFMTPQTVLIRHMAVRINRASLKKVPAIESGMPMPTPIVGLGKRS